MNGVADPIHLTERAVSRLQTLLAGEADQGKKFRVYITGGGCAGFSYGFKFDDQVSEEDTVLDQGGLKVLIDPLSVQYLEGSEVDYEEGLQGARFVVKNPNAASTCGCGSSFSV